MDVPILLGVGLVFLTLILFLTLFMIVVYSGLFTNVEVGAGKPPVQNVSVAYKFGVGAYKTTGFIFTEAVSIAPKHRSFGVYYDNPEEVEEEKLRWAVGMILAEGDEKPDEELVKTFKDNEYQMYQFPAVSNVVRTAFPHVTPLSILIGVYKVYPRLGAYIKENKLCAYPMLEIYDGDVIHYMAPLSKQEDFYVPECDTDYDPDFRDEVEHARKLLEDYPLEASDDEDRDYVPGPEEREKREESLLRHRRPKVQKKGKKEEGIAETRSKSDIPADSATDSKGKLPHVEHACGDKHLNIIPDAMRHESKEASCSSSVPSMVGAAGKTANADNSTPSHSGDNAVTSSNAAANPSPGDSSPSSPLGSEASSYIVEPSVASSGLVSESSITSFSSLSSDSASSDDAIETSSFEELKMDELQKKE